MLTKNVNLVKKIFNKVGWTGLIIITSFILIYTYGLFRKGNRTKDPLYTKGISLGVQIGVSAHYYLYYKFSVNNQLYNGSVTNDFCQKCPKCCNVGDTVIVRFQRDNPENNDLVTELPEGAAFEGGN